MRYLVVFVLLLSFSSVRADTTSHRAAASELIELINGPLTLRSGFNAFINPMLDGLKQRGASEEALAEFKAAFLDWLDKEIIWDEIKVPMIALYLEEFSEQELRELAAFYRTPTGAKALKRMPFILTKGAKVGQDCAQTKQASLVERINKVVEKFHLK